MKRKLIYLINPISGTRGKSGLRELVMSRTRQAGVDYDIYPSVANGDYSFLDEIIREQKVTDIIIAGGDGTINQAVNSLRKHDVNFGIIPCGSGNGLAFSAGIPKDPNKALDIIFNGKPQSTDAFMINDTFACMLCGLGFDAQVAHDFANDPKRGLATYIKHTIKNFISAKAYTFKLKVKEKELVTDALFISIANSNQFGNHFTIAPKASLTDGMLDIVVMTKQNKLSMLLQSTWQVLGGNNLKEVDVISEKSSLMYFQTDEIEIINAMQAPLHIDGDPAETSDRFNIRLLKGCFRMMYP